MSLVSLKDIDSLREIPFDKCECFLHEDHRWILPIIHHFQEKGTLPKPCTLIMFDRHHDSKKPPCIKEISQMRGSGFTFDDLIELCKSGLSTRDDDWIIAGMELGLIENAAIFGVENHTWDFPKTFKDGHGDEHRIELPGLPGGALRFQGVLSDLAKKEELSPLWDILEWEHTRQGPGFKKGASKILLDFDLDCFVVDWEEFLFPWPDEVFEKRFLEASDYDLTEGWTGKKFVDGLIDRAALITIAREPNHCGGDEKADGILEKVNRFLFEGKLGV